MKAPNSRVTLKTATGVQAGLSTREQLDIALRFIAAKGGEALMKDIDDAVEAEMNARSYTLSQQGHATLRELVNRNAVQRGWIHPSRGRNKPWRITPSGRAHVASVAEPTARDIQPVDAGHPDNPLPEEVLPTASYIEGATCSIRVNAYERSRDGREACIRHHGVNCAVCGFNFERTYGATAAGFIHVHHLKRLAVIGEKYVLDPVADLRPVCPNCHAVIHHKDPPYSIDEAQTMIRNGTHREGLSTDGPTAGR
jgi:predicted HNH restriction endonuclease